MLHFACSLFKDETEPSPLPRKMVLHVNIAFVRDDLAIIMFYFVETQRIIYSPKLLIGKPGSSVEIKSVKKSIQKLD